MTQFLICILDHWMNPLLIIHPHLINLIRIFLLQWIVKNGPKLTLRKIRQSGPKKRKNKRKLLFKLQKKLYKNKEKQALIKITRSQKLQRKKLHKNNKKLKINRQLRKYLLCNKKIYKLNSLKKKLNKINCKKKLKDSKIKLLKNKQKLAMFNKLMKMNFRQKKMMILVELMFFKI